MSTVMKMLHSKVDEKSLVLQSRKSKNSEIMSVRSSSTTHREISNKKTKEIILGNFIKKNLQPITDSTN
jgi:hypothetical protein